MFIGFGSPGKEGKSMTETPYKKAWIEWRKSLEGRGCANLDSLVKPHIAGPEFLETRLKLAFAAAWNARGEVKG